MPVQCTNPNCKHINIDGAKFCNHCGSALQTDINQGELRPEQKPPGLPEQWNQIFQNPTHRNLQDTILSPPPPSLPSAPKIRGGVVGIVRHKRVWQSEYVVTSAPGGYGYKRLDWIVFLQRTDESWNVLKDKRGFELPPVEIEYKSNIVRGPTIEAGDYIVVKAGWRANRHAKKKRRVRAKEIWNYRNEMSLLDLVN